MERRSGKSVQIVNIEVPREVREVAQTIKMDWTFQIGRIDKRIEKGRYPKKISLGNNLGGVLEIPLSENKLNRLMKQRNVLATKLDGLSIPGKKARQHLYAAVGSTLTRAQLKKAFQ